MVMATSLERKHLKIPQPFVVRRVFQFASIILVGFVLFFLSTPRIFASPQINGEDHSTALQKLEIKVLAGSPPVPVAHARVRGAYRAILPIQTDFDQRTNREGILERERLPHSLVVHASSPDGTLAAIAKLNATDHEVQIVLKPTKTVTGKVLERVTKKPVPHEDILFGYDVYSESSPPMFLKRTFDGHVQTDHEGHFSITSLASDEEYHIAGRFNADAESPIRLTVALTNASTKASTQVIDLGVFYRSRLPKSSAYDLVINSSFSSTQSLEQRFQERLNESRIGQLRPLILIGSPTAVSTQPFFEALYASRESRDFYGGYWLIGIPTTGPQAAEAERFANQHKFTFPNREGLWMAALDEKGECLAEATDESLSTDGKIDADKVLAFLKQNALDPGDAQQMLDSALAQAKQESKRVFVIEGATWCGPCWMLNGFLDKQKTLLEKDYILLKLDQRLNGTKALVNNLRQGAESGIPWYAILDHDGQPMTSSLRDGHNIGFPADKDGYNHFLDMLDQTRQRLTPEELATIKTALEIKR